MVRLMRGLGGLFVVLLVTGCAKHVSVDYDREINFGTYHTYGLATKSAQSTDDPRLNSPFIDQRIAAALAQELNSKGFVQHAENPDLQVRYQINLKQEIASDASGVTMMLGSGMGRTGFGMGYTVPREDVESYEKCMLTIDVLAAPTEKLLWRGTGMRRIPESSTAGHWDSFFAVLVKEIMAQFPPS